MAHQTLPFADVLLRVGIAFVTERRWTYWATKHLRATKPGELRPVWSTGAAKYDYSRDAECH